jgi:hypothetical protein
VTDEAHFRLSGCVNKQNFRYWSEENLQQLHPRPFRNARSIVWCGLANFGVTGPYFFEDEDGRAVTVTSARYVEILRNFFTPELSSRPCGSSKMVQLPIQREHPWSRSGSVSGARYFTAWRDSMACTFT